MKYTKKWILGILLFDVFVLIWALGHTRQSDKTPTSTNAQDGQSQVNDEGSDGELYVLKGKDEEDRSITVLHVPTNKEETLFYTGATSVKNRHGGEMTMTQLQEGEIIDVLCDPMTGAATRVRVSETAWEYPKVQRWKVLSSENRMEIGDRNYRIHNDLPIFSGSERIDWMDVNEVDELTVKGVGENVYSVIVTKGHGYVRPMNYDDFIGGMVSVGYGVIRPITKDMLIVVKEGTYDVTMQNGDLIGTKNVVVTRNMETPLDMADFKPEPEHVGKVEFEITPYGADLYVNGTLTDYKKAVSLNYGKHKVRVTLTGYEDYYAVLDVRTPNPTIVIDLADDESQVSEEPEATDASTKIEGTTNGRNEENVVVDEDHTITISEPEGVNVYFNGAFKGTSPCSFTKQIGTHTITLSMAGYTTKSYTVQIANDQENVEWKFPAFQ